MVYVRSAILALILILGLTCWGLWNANKYERSERERAWAEVERVAAVNAENARVMKEMREDQALERLAVEKELKRAADRLARSQQLVREMRNVPGANDPAGPFWDEYSKRLRANGDRAPSH